MSLDYSLYVPTLIPEYGSGREELFTANITHNLTTMADQAELYEVLWYGDKEDNTYTAGYWIPLLEEGLQTLKDQPRIMKKYTPDNGWDTYEDLIEFTESVLQACKEYPKALVHCCR